MQFNEYKEIAHAPKLSKMRSDRFYGIERHLSARFSWMLFRLFPSLQPNHVTFFSFLLVIAVFVLSILMRYQYEMISIYAIGGLILLYLVNILDKIDGELARATGRITQIGAHYDRVVHFFYPYAFYLLAGSYFFSLYENFTLFITAVIAAILTHQFLFLTESKLMIAEKIRGGMDFTDLYKDKPLIKRPHLLFRLIDYSTFMIYSWSLFLYLGLFIVSILEPFLAYQLFSTHLIIIIVVNSYKIFISYPYRRFFTVQDEEKFRKQINS